MFHHHSPLFDKCETHGNDRLKKMADTDLDSFFAKKDKKKKDKKKGVSNDDLDKKFDNKPTTGERSRERRFPILDNFIQV